MGLYIIYTFPNIIENDFNCSTLQQKTNKLIMIQQKGNVWTKDWLCFAVNLPPCLPMQALSLAGLFVTQVCRKPCVIMSHIFAHSNFIFSTSMIVFWYNYCLCPQMFSIDEDQDCVTMFATSFILNQDQTWNSCSSVLINCFVGYQDARGDNLMYTGTKLLLSHPLFFN